MLMAIYTCFLLYVAAGYFYDSKLQNLGFYDFMWNYFGYFNIFLMVLIFLGFCSYFIKCSKKKMVYNIRLKFFVLCVISAIFLVCSYILKLPFEKMLADENHIQSSVKLFVYDYKLGFVLGYAYNYLITHVYFNYLYISLYTIIFISLFFILAKRIRVALTTYIKNRRERKKREIERKLVQEQIKLMEALERKEQERIEKRRATVEAMEAQRLEQLMFEETLKKEEKERLEAEQRDRQLEKIMAMLEISEENKKESLEEENQEDNQDESYQNAFQNVLVFGEEDIEDRNIDDKNIDGEDMDNRDTKDNETKNKELENQKIDENIDEKENIDAEIVEDIEEKEDSIESLENLNLLDEIEENIDSKGEEKIDTSI